MFFRHSHTKIKKIPDRYFIVIHKFSPLHSRMSNKAKSALRWSQLALHPRLVEWNMFDQVDCYKVEFQL